MITHTSRYLTIILSFFSFLGFAQLQCSFDMMHEQQIKDIRNNPYKSLNEQLRAIAASKTSSTSYTIPIVVHVIETGTVLGTPEKPSDAQIIAGIDALTKMYRATYPGFPDVSTGGVDIDISFQLAKRDPDCNSTTGIIRIDKSNDPAFANSTIYSAGVYALYAMSHWNPQEYCNLYLVPNVGAGFSSYAEYPAPNVFEGVGINTHYFPGFYPYPRILAHEMGHYLGLYHTFGGSSDPTTICSANTTCTLDGDRVCDTDPHLQVCPNTTNHCSANAINSCTGLPLGNLYYNYMSYYADTIGLFTQGQKARMLQLATQFRSSVLNSPAIYPPQPTMPHAIVYAQYSNSMSMAYCEGDPLDFYVTGSGHGNSPQYAWYVNGVFTTTTTSQGPVTFTVHATDTVTCKLTSSSLCATTQTVMSNKYNYPLVNGGPISGTVTRLTNDTLCIGDSLKFLCQVNNTGDFLFQWLSSFNNPGVIAYSTFPNSTILKTVVDTSYLHNTYTIFSPRWLYLNCLINPLSFCSSPRSTFIRDSVYIAGPKPAKPTISFSANHFQCSTAPHYQWYSVSTGAIAGATAQTYTPTQSGNYYCVISNGYCRSIASDTLNFIGTGITQYELNQTISLYPNPAAHEVIISSSNGEIKKIELLSISGQSIKTYELQGKPQKLDVSELSTGAYFLKIYITAGYISYKKLMVEKSN